MQNKLFFGMLSFLFIVMVACHSEQPKLKHLMPGDVILAFGDSLTYGTGATPNTSYPQSLQNITGFKVINAGIPGEETSASLLRIKSVLDSTHPKLVLVCLGGNDLLHKRSQNQIKENLKKIIEIIQQSGSQIILIAVPEPGLFLEAPNFYQELSDELQVPVDNDTIPALMKKPEYKSDYIHFNATGYQMLAQHIANFLRQEGVI